MSEINPAELLSADQVRFRVPPAQRQPHPIPDRLNVGEAIYRDQIGRPTYAFGLWLATVQAARLGIRKLQVFEFGVAFGDGLLNMCDICDLITRSTDMQFEIYGFDSDVGMPGLEGYVDHPEIWHEGQFHSDHDGIRQRLTPNGNLISGNIRDTLGPFMEAHLSPETPVGFVSIDVDLYSSTRDLLPLLKHPDPECYLPTTVLYLDDVHDLLSANRWCGEALAVEEFNQEQSRRKIDRMRIRQNHQPVGWHDQFFGLHVLDHPVRTGARKALLDINITII